MSVFKMYPDNNIRIPPRKMPRAKKYQIMDVENYAKIQLELENLLDQHFVHGRYIKDIDVYL